MLDINRPPDGSSRSRTLTATWVSAGLHAALALGFLFILREKPPIAARTIERHDPPQIVWLERLGDIGGGGRSGNNSTAPPERVQRRGSDRKTLSARPPLNLVATKVNRQPVQEISVPAMPQASGVGDTFGVVSTVAVADPSSLGPLSGRGSGDGEGDGLERGFGRNTGGGPPGAGAILSPEIIRQVRPNYTNAALQARVRGLVVMDAVVLPDGSVGDVKIVRSLDKRFGLDEEAIKAVKQWRFRPARRSGDPVAMLVSVEMMFELR
jgi:protein TonB